MPSTDGLKVGSSPTVSVIMLAYNSAKYLPEAIESILSQTFKDFEFLIVVEPGSTDNTDEIAHRYAQRDSRIHVAIQPTRGLTAARIFAWPLAQGKYIAWADSDDVCLPERLKKQVAFMENHPDIGICGSWIKVIGDQKTYVQKYELTDGRIRSLLPFQSPFANPSVIMRRSLFTQDGLDYSQDCIHCEDYDLWERASLICRFANIGEVLVAYRFHQTEVSKQAYFFEREYSNRTRLRALRRLNITPTEEEFDLHVSISLLKTENTPSSLDRAESWFLRLDAANRKMKIFPPRQFSDILATYWLGICVRMVVKSQFRAILRIFTFPLMSPSVLGRKFKNTILLQLGR